MSQMQTMKTLLESMDTIAYTPVTENNINGYEGREIEYPKAYAAGKEAAEAGTKISDINVSDQWAHEGGDFRAGHASVKQQTTEGEIEDYDPANDEDAYAFDSEQRSYKGEPWEQDANKAEKDFPEYEKFMGEDTGISTTEVAQAIMDTAEQTIAEHGAEATFAAVEAAVAQGGESVEELVQRVLADLNSELEEDNTQIQKQGNNVKVTANGDTTTYDEETFKMMNNGEEDNQFSTESVDRDTILTKAQSLAKADGKDYGSLKMGDQQKYIKKAGGKVQHPNERYNKSADFYNGYGGGSSNDESKNVNEAFGEYDDFNEDEIEYTTFDSTNPDHRKRLQDGTPVVLDPSICSDPEGDRTGIFATRSPSGHYGTVVRNADNKTINVHLSDIVSADITNNSVYESMTTEFNKLMDLNEEVTITQTQNPDQPDNDTMTITGSGESVDELSAMLANAGFGQAEADVVDTGAPVTQSVPAGKGLTMGDMMAMVDAPVQEPVTDEMMPMDAQAPSFSLTGEIDEAGAAQHKTQADGYMYNDGNYEDDVTSQAKAQDVDYMYNDGNYEDDDRARQVTEMDDESTCPHCGEAGEMTYSSAAQDSKCGYCGEWTKDDADEYVIADESAAPEVCSTCDGDGGYRGQTCDDCGGSGIAHSDVRDEACPDCNGEDQEVTIDGKSYSCSTCGGSGTKQSNFDREGEFSGYVEEDEDDGKGLQYDKDYSSSDFDMTGYKTCPDCNGTGEMEMLAPQGTEMTICVSCDGEGMVPDDNIEEERDIQHSNTPQELIAKADVVINKLSGGLNDPKNSYKPVAGGDNPMAVNESASFMKLYKAFNERG